MRRALPFLVVAACSSNPSTPTTDGGGDDGPTPTIEGGVVCATDKSPKEDKCVLDEKYGVFVSATLGAADGDGSRTKPLKTIQAGIDLAKSTKRNVYVCAEQYVEQLAFANAVHTYGYLDCANGWTPADARALVSSNAIPVARADGAQLTTRIEGFELRAAPNVMPNASSIALVLVNASGLKLAEMTIHADKAGDGVDGVNAVQLTDMGSAKNGTQAQIGFMCNTINFSCSAGPLVPAAVPNACMGKMGLTPGTGGGGGGPSLYTRTNGNWGLTQSATNGAAQPATPSTAKGGLVGGAGPQAGAPGTDGTNGVPGTDIGGIDAMKLFVTADGTAGTDGQVGQGGGGGAGLDVNPGNLVMSDGTKAWGNSGGSGGAGGCPGLAATAGTGGGASIGILAIDSPFTIDSSKIDTGAGGAGGKAGVAGTSTLGGTGGASVGQTQGGGNGGSGGIAGASGNGAGGPSIGVAYKGVTPTVKTTTMIMPGMGGKGVAQRVIIDLATIVASPDGKSSALVGY
jgi:hypothetical protein